MKTFKQFLLEAKDFFPKDVNDIRNEITHNSVDKLIGLFLEVKPLADKVGSDIVLAINPNKPNKPTVYFPTKLDRDDLISDEMIARWRKEYGFPNSSSRQANFTRKTTSSAGKISGAGWEKVICVAWNMEQTKFKDESSALEVAGITEFPDHYSNALDAGKIIAEVVAKESRDMLGKPMLHYGAGSSKVSPTWKGHYDTMRWMIDGWKASDQPLSASRTPKTDMRFEDGHRISAKKAGGSQLMSGGDFETVGTISVAMAKMKEDNRYAGKLGSYLDNHKSSMIREIRPKVEKGKKTGGGFVIQAFPRAWKTMSGKEGAQTQMEIDPDAGLGKRYRRKVIKDKPTKKDTFIDWVIEQTNMQEKVQQSLDWIMESELGDIFERAMVHEAMTGAVKFGVKSMATATHILKWTESGNRSQYKEINDEYVTHVAENTTFNVSFKTSGTGKSAWSALKLIFTESFEDIGGQYLTEQDMLDEGVIWNFIKRWLGKVWDKVVEIAKRSMSKLMEIFGLKIKVDLKKNYAF